MPRAHLAVAIAALTLAPLGARAAEAWKPGLGDLMTMAIQPRHTKLALAGQATNWPYAAYELDERPRRWRTPPPRCHAITASRLAPVSTS